MHHVGYAADLIHRIEHDDGLRGVGHTDGDSLPLLNADGRQGSGAVINFIYEILVSHLAAHEIVGDVVRIVSRHFRDLIVHGSLEIVQVSRDAAQVLDPRSLNFRFSLSFFFRFE